MKTIMIDMDDVITCGNFERAVEKYLGYKYDFSTFKGYRMQEVLGDKRSDFFKWLRDINYYEEATLLPDCYNVLKKLNEHYEIYIVTDYVWPEKEMLEHNGKFINSKYIFLQKTFDFMNPRQFVFVANKKLINCDIKIDDRIDNLDGAETKLLFTAYHNKTLDNNDLIQQNIVRVNNWKEISNTLL